MASILKASRAMAYKLIASEILSKLLRDETGQNLRTPMKPREQLVDQALGCSCLKTIEIHFILLKSIVGIGAPVGAFLPHIARKLHTSYIVPPDAEVGNAIGTTLALVSQSVEVLVQPLVKGSGTVKYLIHSVLGRAEDSSLSSAVNRAEALATELARKAAYNAGARDVEVKLEQKKVMLGKLAEVTIRATAKGRPRERIILSNDEYKII